MTDVPQVHACPPWEPKFVISDGIVEIDDIKIEFKRTIRVPDNQHVSQLPHSLGNFPLKYVKGYAETVSETMKDKGGIFFPMYRKLSVICPQLQC